VIFAPILTGLYGYVFNLSSVRAEDVMHSFLKCQWLISCGAVFALMSVGCGPASAEKFELVYRATLNEGTAPFSGFIGLPLPAGTPLTITAEFDTSSADYWNTGAYIYTALSPTFVIGATDELYNDELGSLFILLSDPSWATFGGPAPYSAGFFRTFPAGAINSVFGSSTAAFQASDPSPTAFYDYQYNFSFAGPGPLTVLLSGGELTLYSSSLSDVTASILPVPEVSTWGLMLFGLAGLAGIAYVRGRAPARLSSG
jgi:hypothetical protein